MTKEKANKICAEFMNTPERDINGFISHLKYISLDALVSVWEKLSPYYGVNFWKDADRYYCRLDHIKQSGYTISKNHSTPQEAACIATGKCIQELKSEG